MRFFLKLCGILGSPGYLETPKTPTDMVSDVIGRGKQRNDAMKNLASFGQFCVQWEEMKEGYNYDIPYSGDD